MSRPLTQKDALDELYAEIVNIDRKHSSHRLSRRVAHRLQPLLAFVDRYAASLDVVSQGMLKPVSLIWGSLRALLVVCFHRHYVHCTP